MFYMVSCVLLTHCIFSLHCLIYLSVLPCNNPYCLCSDVAIIIDSYIQRVIQDIGSDQQNTGMNSRCYKF